jgi:hypothetical protein
MSKPHRGRIQAQSDHIEESVTWAQEKAPDLKEGLDMVKELKEKLNKKELKLREKQFKEFGAIYEKCFQGRWNL